MFKQEDFDSENYRICWPTILAVHGISNYFAANEQSFK
jgi:hypothetical protein